MTDVLHTILNFFLAVLSHLLDATVLTFLELFLLFGPLVLAALASHAVSLRIESRLVRLVGTGGFVYSLGWLGTPVHELGHAAMCLLFRHKIRKVQLFSPDLETGRIGYVEHSYDSASLYQQVGNVFIAAGPIFLGGAVLYGAAALLVGADSLRVTFDTGALVGSLSDIPAAILAWAAHVGTVLKNLLVSLSPRAWQTWLFLYVVLAVGSHVNLSPADLKAARGGFTMLLVIFFAANVVMTLFTDVPLAVFRVGGRFVGMLSSLVLLCTGLLVPLWLVLEGLARAFAGNAQPVRRAAPKRRS